jgi:hypothetical protein
MKTIYIVWFNLFKDITPFENEKIDVWKILYETMRLLSETQEKTNLNIALLECSMNYSKDTQFTYKKTSVGFSQETSELSLIDLWIESSKTSVWSHEFSSCSDILNHEINSLIILERFDLHLFVVYDQILIPFFTEDKTWEKLYNYYQSPISFPDISFTLNIFDYSTNLKELIDFENCLKLLKNSLWSHCCEQYTLRHFKIQNIPMKKVTLL